MSSRMRNLDKLFGLPNWDAASINRFCSRNNLGEQLGQITVIAFERVYWMLRSEHGQGKGDLPFLSLVRQYGLARVQAAMLYAAIIIARDFELEQQARGYKSDQQNENRKRADQCIDRLHALLTSTAEFGLGWRDLKRFATKAGFFSESFTEHFDRLMRGYKEAEVIFLEESAAA